MKSIVQTAGSFDKVLETCKRFGERYQPNRPELSITALSEMSERSRQAMRAVLSARGNYSHAVDRRQESFESIPKLSVRIVNMLVGSKANKRTLEEAISLKNQLHRARRKRKSSAQVTTEGGAVPARQAANRKNFEMKMKTFTLLVDILEKVPTYAPNESDLTLDALRSKVAELESTSRQVLNAKLDYVDASKAAQEIMFGHEGVDERLTELRAYIRGAFGAISRQTDQMTSVD